MRLLGIQLTVAFLVEAAAWWIGHITKNNLAVYNVYDPLDLLLLMIMAVSILPRLRRPAVIAVSVALAIWCCDMLFWRGPSEGANIFKVTADFVITAFYLRILWGLSERISGRLWDDLRFIVCLAVVIHYGASTPIEGSVGFLYRGWPKLAAELWWIITILCTLRFTIIGLGCIHHGRLRQRMVHG